MSKLKLATVWLDGCSGCHMSFLDMDERLIAMLQLADLVYSPLVDAKAFPEEVDITLVEGAVSNEDDLHKLQNAREHTRTLVALGDCSVSGNVPAMRNPFGRTAVLERAYTENADHNQQFPFQIVPKLLPFSKPLHELVKVDVFVPGCPPLADTIVYALQELLAGRMPQFEDSVRFGS